jgi:hypothetical protein
VKAKPPASFSNWAPGAVTVWAEAATVAAKKAEMNRIFMVRTEFDGNGTANPPKSFLVFPVRVKQLAGAV